MPSSLAKARRRAALDDLIAKQAPQQQEPEPRIQDARRGARGGRPRLGDDPEFSRGFAAVLRRLSEGTMSQREAARELGVSARSVGRYVRMASST